MSNIDPNPFTHKECNLFPPYVLEEAFQTLTEEDAK